MILEEATLKEAHDMFTQTHLAIIPIDAIERPRSPNPMGIGCYTITELAKRRNERMKVIITPSSVTTPVAFVGDPTQDSGAVYKSPERVRKTRGIGK